jgi:hypothetical protein
MPAPTLQNDRGGSLQNAFAYGRGGVQNGTFNRQVYLANPFQAPSTELFIDGDGRSRLVFPSGTTIRGVGTVGSITFDPLTGTVTQPSVAVFDYTFVTTATGVMTPTANVAPVAFAVNKINVPHSQGNDQALTLLRTGATGNTRGWASITFSDQTPVTPSNSMRSVASAAAVQAGLY